MKSYEQFLFEKYQEEIKLYQKYLEQSINNLLNIQIKFEEPKNEIK